MSEGAADAQLTTLGQAELNPGDGTPSVTFESIEFSDGTTISLHPSDVVVLVGPNNAGKSAVLRELEDAFARGNPSTVLRSCKTQTSDTTKKDFASFVLKHAQIKPEKGSRTVGGYGWQLSGDAINLEGFWPDNLTRFRSMFCLRMPTERRITGSDPPEVINIREQAAEHPIHILLGDDTLEIKISEYFRRAFHNDLMLDRNPARNISLLVGTRPTRDLQSGEDRVSKAYLDKIYDATAPLVQQGDGMRSFASVILHLLAPITASILLLDEPEAFLHPPQARFLGEIIATEKPSRSQLFVATHSSDVLQGLVNVATDQLRVVRMRRDGNINRIKELDKGLVKKISSDPLMNYSSVMSGVFHERVIVCESDSDCMFYRSILDLKEIHGEGQPDVLFIHANGKDRMGALAEILLALDVPVDVVADIDVIRDESGLELMVRSLGGDWSRIKPVAKIVRTAVDGSKPSLSIEQIKESVRDVLAQDLPDSEPQRHLRSMIDIVFRHSSPWDTLKQSGDSAIPKGHATQKFQELLRLCQEVGLWIVPVGEMEGFCRSIGNHGPSWVQQVIEERKLETDPDLADARQFVRELWDRRP